ncbi:MAG: 6-bladed beta-propeller [Mangrovibacterium sp.]
MKSPQRHGVLYIDPTSYTDNGLKLSDISDEIIYIPLKSDSPIGQINDLKFMNNSMYINIGDSAIIKFDNEGKQENRIGRLGQGPGEYLFCNSFGIDDKGTIYLIGTNSKIYVYSSSGDFIRNIEISNCPPGINFSDIDICNSNLFLSQYINRGHSRYNWIIIDTSGNLIREKLSYHKPFNSTNGPHGGISRYKNKLLYWSMYNDTIFSIHPDSVTIEGFFITNEKIQPKDVIKLQSPSQIFQYYTPNYIMETNIFWLHKYCFKNQIGIVTINKEDQSTKASLGELKLWGIPNDLDGGTSFQPISYYDKKEDEYLIGTVYPYQLKAHIASDEFKNSTPKYPEKKKELEKLANNLKENDNPVLMLVKLKKE